MSKVLKSIAGLALILGVTASQALGQAPEVKAGPEHELLKATEGTWDCVIKVEDAKSKGTSTSKLMQGGLWLTTDFKGSFGDATGGVQEFEGHGVDGYDPEKKKFVSVWVDSMTSSIMTLEGTYDERTKTLTMLGQGNGPAGPKTKFKMMTTHPDKDHQLFKMFFVADDDSENLMMTIEYTRKK